MVKAEVTVRLADYDEIKAFVAEAARWREALEFYADPKHWEAVELEKITDALSSWASGPAMDGGARARAALADSCTDGV